MSQPIDSLKSEIEALFENSLVIFVHVCDMWRVCSIRLNAYLDISKCNRDHWPNFRIDLQMPVIASLFETFCSSIHWNVCIAAGASPICLWVYGNKWILHEKCNKVIENAKFYSGIYHCLAANAQMLIASPGCQDSLLLHQLKLERLDVHHANETIPNVLEHMSHQFQCIV